ncbi:MAG TPA: serine/threonine-protein kinase [Kofleriaceae bacterium]|nr:serine/threonine-protein kinase [Kofleriaceae bacterium]
MSGTIAFGKFELLRRIASGGMAEVFAARMTSVGGFEKMVALKRILPDLAERPEYVNMFLDEARIAASLNHPNIVQVYDIDAVEGQYFMTMEYLRGHDLRHVLKELRRSGSGMPLALALRIVSEVAGALHYAHERRGLDRRPLGIVHRDVSPKNIFITFDGVIKLLDFGIAKAHHRLAVTRTGTLKGRYPYMAPEQVVDDEVDSRADVFALGICLWEMTTGRRLFEGKTAYEILKKIRDQPVPRPSSVVAGYSPAVESVVMRALVKDPGQRYQTCLAMQRDLEKAGALGLHQSVGAVATLMEEMFGEGWRTPISLSPTSCEVDEIPLGDDEDTGTPLVDLPLRAAD